MFPELLVLPLVNSNKTTMEKIYYYVNKATLSIEKNSDNLNNPILFFPPEENDEKNGYDYPDSST